MLIGSKFLKIVLEYSYLNLNCLLLPNMLKYLFILLISFSTFATIPTGLSLVEITTGNSPLAFISANDGSDKMYIVEKAGIIKVFENNNNSLFLDISSKVQNFYSDQGLLGLVFDPNYANNGYFYVNYTKAGGAFNLGVTVVERYQTSANTQIANPKSAVIILEVDQYYHNHNGGTMLFGEDGYLYIAMGDGGYIRDPLNYSQNLGELLGKMLRIDVNPDIIFKNTMNLVNKCGLIANYYIIEDNPFANDLDKCGEIYFYGLRSPWKWSFDKETHDIFIGDVGQDAIEEVSFIASSTTGGENLGWSCKEANSIIIPERCPKNMSSLTDPIISYNHNPDESGNSIVGGYRYRGTEMPELIGTYIYCDTMSGEVWFAEFDGTNWISTLWDQTVNFVVSFAEDDSGNLYTVSINGSIKKFIIQNI